MAFGSSNTQGVLARLGSALQTPIRLGGGTGKPKVQTTPVDEGLARIAQSGSNPGGLPVLPSLTLEEATREAYSTSHFVHGCVSKIATSVASVPWGLEQRGKDRQWTPVPDSDYEALLERPNPFMHGSDLFERWTQHLILTGNAIGIKVRTLTGKGSQPKEIWPVQPDFIKPVPDRMNYLSHYELKVEGGGTVPIDPNDVIHIQIADPRNPHWGMSPLVALSRVVATEIDALTWWRQSIRNRASKFGYISFQNELSPEQFDQVQSALVAQATGPWNAGLPFILGNEAKWVPSSSTPQEMDFTNLRKMTREEICGILGVSPILMGVQDFSSYNNMVTARLMLWLDTICPILSNFRAALDLALLPDFIAPNNLRQYQTGYDLTNVDALVQNLVNVISVAQTLFAIGVPFNQINSRLKLGFVKFDGWDTSWLPSGLVPSAQLAENAAEAGGAGGAPGGAHGPTTDLAAEHQADAGATEPKQKSRFTKSANSAYDAIKTLRDLVPQP
jgi:HK97 family phage portal protein